MYLKIGKNHLWFSFLIFIKPIVEAKNIEELSHEMNVSKVFCLIFVGIVFSLILFNINRYFHLPFPYRVVVLAFGVVIGLLLKFQPHFEKDIQENIILKPNLLFMITVPIIIFRICFNLDIHTFVRSWVQIFVLAGPGYILNTVFTGLLMMLLMKDFSFAAAIMFGCLCTSTYPIEIVALLNEVGQFKPLTVLLQGESVIGDATVLILFTLSIGVLKGVLGAWYQVISVFLRFSIGGAIVGYIFGFTLIFLMRTIRNDTISMTMLPLAVSFIAFFVATEIIAVSSVITIVVIGIKTGMEKTSMSKENETFMINFWDLLAECVDTVMCILAGYILVKYFSYDDLLRDNAIVIVTYIVSTTGRIFSYIIVTPVVSRLAYGLTFKEMVIAVWSGLKGPNPLVLALIACQSQKHIGPIMLFHLSSLMVLTLLINASSMPYVLKILGVSEVSVARKMNMNNCMRHLRNRREHSIRTLKMDRFLSDANWSVVNEAVEVKHPYKINYSDSEDESDILFYTRPITCPDCKKEFSYEPTSKEMVAMLREARLRILKAKKISYTRQYETGLLSKDGVRVLLQAVEVAMDTPNAVIELEGLQRYFKRQGFMHYTRRKLLDNFFNKTDSPGKPPRKYWRRVCYRLVTNHIFELILHFFIVMQIVMTFFELLSPPKPSTSGLGVAVITVNIFSFVIFFIEFVFKILAFSWIYVCKHGFKTYFRSYWNIFDFVCLCVMLVDVIIISIDLQHPNLKKYDHVYYTAVLTAKLFRIIRLIRMLTLFKRLYPMLILYCDSKIDEHSAFAYDIGKGFVAGEEEMLSILPQIIDNDAIRESCRSRINADRLIITKELGMIQKDKPWIAVTVKTRQAVQSTLNSMKDVVQELKLAGGVDDFEHKKLMNSFDDSFKRVRKKLKSVQPSTPKEMFKEIPWMTGDDEICDFLYNNVMVKVFDSGDVVCVDGEPSDNIYVLVIGIFKLTYIPKLNVLDRLYEYGALPVIDYISSPIFKERIQDYILSGNCIGELSVLTDRSYDCNIVAESASQVYVITKEIIREAFSRNPNIAKGLEARMWKAISMRLATTILMETPAYQSIPLDQIKFILERSFVPNLSNVKVFYVNDLIEDIILLEGLIWDWIMKTRYTAPCYVPRTVQKIMLPISMNYLTVVETKLLIIPTKDVVDFEIMEKLQDGLEMVSVTSSKCLRHVVKSKISKKKMKLGPYGYYKRSRSIESQSYSLSQSKSILTEMTVSTMTAPSLQKVPLEAYLNENINLTNSRLDNKRRESIIKKFAQRERVIGMSLIKPFRSNDKSVTSRSYTPSIQLVDYNNDVQMLNNGYAIDECKKPTVTEKASYKDTVLSSVGKNLMHLEPTISTPTIESEIELNAIDFVSEGKHSNVSQEIK